MSDKIPVILLIWENIPESTELYLVPWNHSLAPAVRQSNNIFINGNDEDNSLIELVQEEIIIKDSLPLGIVMVPTGSTCQAEILEKYHIVQLVVCGFLA